MERTIDVKQIERKAYLSFHQDGLLDILMGIFILAFGLSMLELPSIMSTVVVVLWTWSTIFFWRVKKSIIYPRLGYVNFSRGRRKKEMTKLAVLIGFWFAAVLAMLIILKGFPASRRAVWLDEYETLSGQIFIAVFISAGAILSGIKRLYVYAVLTLLVFVTDYLLNVPTHLYLIPLGIAVIISGTVVLTRFLHRYPKLAAEVPNRKA